MKLIEYLKNNGIEKLVSDYHVRATYSTKYSELVCLCYDHTNTPKNEITNECRGIILNKDTFEIIAYPFTRFSDYNPKGKQNFDFDNFSAYEKVDGSLITMYYYAGVWNIGTKGTPDAHGFIRGLDTTYNEYFWQVWDKLGYELPESGFDYFTYIFEFKFPSESQFITECKKPTITLIGCRSLFGPFPEVDLKSKKWNWDIPPYKNWITAQKYEIGIGDLVNKSYYLNPFKSEGYVLVDSKFNRLKLKSPAYDLILLLKSEFQSEFQSEEKIEEVRNHNKRILIKISKYFAPNKSEVSFQWFYNYNYKQFIGILEWRELTAFELNRALSEIQGLDGKELGLLCKTHQYGSILFMLKKYGSAELLFRNISEKTYCDLFTNYLKYEK